jgi:putative membrane-bound dehydrogenase-like protein
VVVNTQEQTVPLTSPEEALAGWRLPEGFEVSLFAAEPEVRQPIGMTFDSRGRLWVAECDTYSDRSENYDLNQRDRIVIFEDTTGNGRADRRTVFWDQGTHLTSVEVGFGGVWALCAPYLLFIPDRDGDDVPDGEPVMVLEGFNNTTIRHNIVNGLKWGPDGWLYGRHGIQATSYVGLPGTAEEDRTAMNCAIWRYHPVRKEFEVVCRGTTNSWGHDWNEHGELFFINTVIGHLWHALPGAHFERMYGEDFNPHLYRLMPQTADHVHWDTSERHSDVKKGVSPGTDEAGGGHAHCGMMIYLGDNWPPEYRGELFTINLHGQRINQEKLVREGAGYVGKHQPDFARSQDPWFRGLELGYGPDGGVFVLDWSDIGECHENDGIHRTSGRIYKITHGPAGQEPMPDLASLSNADLLTYLSHENEWSPRMVRRLLQERAVEGADVFDVVPALRSMASLATEGPAKAATQRSQRAESDDPRYTLRALWCLFSIGELETADLVSLLDAPHEAVRSQAVALLSDGPIDDPALVSRLADMAEREEAGLVLLRLASALQRLPLEKRFQLGAPLATKAEFADDPHLPLMVWYGLEPAAAEQPELAVDLLPQVAMPEVRRFIARRIGSQLRTDPAGVDLLVKLLPEASVPVTIDVLQGMTAAFEGWRKAPQPEHWERTAARLNGSDHDDVRRLARELSVIFGDGRAVGELREVILSGEESLTTRRNAVRSLVAARDERSVELLQKLLSNRDLAPDAIRGLAAFSHPETAELIVRTYPRLLTTGRREAIETLASRPEYARHLLRAVSAGRIPQNEVPPFYVRQLRAFEDDEVQASLQELWPEWRHTSEEKLEKIEEYRDLLTEKRISSADVDAGRELFRKSCANCHTLFGAGGRIGPDLTGAQRGNLNYLLENIVDPSAQVAEKYRMSLVALADGRVVSGVIVRETEETTVIQTPNELLTIVNEDVEAVRRSELSMMPERLLDQMTDEEVAALIAFLMKDAPAPAPTGE